MWELIAVLFLQSGHAAQSAAAAKTPSCELGLTPTGDHQTNIGEEIEALEAKANEILSLVLNELHPTDELVSSLRRLEELDAAFATSSGHFRQLILQNMTDVIAKVPEFGAFANALASAKLARSIATRALSLPGRPFGSRHAVLFVLYHQYSSVSSRCRIHMELLSTMAGQRSHLESIK